MALLIVFNNYFHDLATGVFAASAVVMWALARWARTHPQATSAMEEVYRALTVTLWIALGWIIVGGIPRVIFFPRYEFIPALGKGIVPALVVKHVFMFLAVAIGLAAWVAARRAMKATSETVD